MPHQEGRSVGSHDCRPWTRQWKKPGGGLELRAQLPPPMPPKPGLTLQEQDSPEGQPPPTLGLTPPGSEAAVPGSLEGEAAAGTRPSVNSALTLGLPTSSCRSPPERDTAAAQCTQDDLSIAASLVNGTPQRGLSCCSFPRCWGLSCNGWGSGPHLPGPTLGPKGSGCGRAKQEGP